MVEEPSPVAEEDRGDDRQDLVELARLEALSRDVGAEHVHIPVPRSGLRRGKATLEVTDEGHARRRRPPSRGGSPRTTARSTSPPKAPSLSVPRFGSSPRNGAVADEERTDVALERLDLGIGPEVGRQPRHVTAWDPR